MLGIHLAVELAEERDFAAEHVEVQKIGLEGVVEVRGVVGNFVYPVDQLGFQGWPELKKILGKLRELRWGIVARMLDDPLANFKRKIQAVEAKIAVLELFHDAQRVQIVVETAAVRTHQLIELSLTRMTKRRVADVVNECECLHEFRIQSESAGDGAGDLGDLQRVGEPVAVVLGATRGKHLRSG